MALILSGDTGVPASGMPTGSVIQTVTNFFTTTSSTTARTFTDVSGFSATITPISTSSKVLVFGQITASPNVTSFGYEAAMRVTRNGTSVGANPVSSTLGAVSSASTTGSEGSQTINFSFIDSPASTSALTYQVQFICGEGVTYYINQNSNQTYVGSYTATGGSSLTVMEIKG